MSENFEKSDKDIIQILIKNTSELNNKLEEYKNIERNHIQKEAQLSIEILDLKTRLEVANKQIQILKEIKKEDEPKKEEPKKEEKKEVKEEPKLNVDALLSNIITEEPKKNFHYIDFLEQKRRLSRNWKTLDSARIARMERNSIEELKKVEEPKKITRILKQPEKIVIDEK